jgi:GDP-6-deoxy-D-talose 4-dehydrogenase
MRIALTGSSGFTGRFVRNALEEAGAECVPLEVDLTDKTAVARAVENSAFDRVLHLAAQAFVAADDWERFYTVNQLGTLHLLDAVARTRTGTRCILASSAQVYGPGAHGLITEEAPTRPANHYAMGKLAMEMSARLWQDRLDIVIARPFNYTGVGQGTQYLIPKIVDHFCRREPVIELGNTWVKRDFGDVRSVAQAYVRLVLQDNVPNLVNIATGLVYSVDQVLDMLRAISGHAIEVRVNPAFVRSNDVPVLGGDPARLDAALHHWQRYNLAETLAWMYEHSKRSIAPGTTEE